MTLKTPSQWVRLTRSVALPDPRRVERALRVPELGPRILFFSGGTALRRLSRRLKTYTHNSIHLITPFDSGGSSAALRAAFGILSVGDLRNRLMALADESVQGNPAIYALFSHRLDTGSTEAECARQLASMVAGVHPLVSAVPSPMRRIVRTHLRVLAEYAPPDLDLRGASIGNLILTGGCIHNDGDMDSVVFLFSQLVSARGTVLPVVDASVHLAATLANGERIVGQHLITGKECPPIEAPITHLELIRSLGDPRPTEITAHPKVTRLIAEADLIVFPMGSFYTSVLCNLLPRGVGRAIVERDCPKIFIPNNGEDPEQLGMTAAEAVARLLRQVRLDAGQDVPANRIIDLVLTDTAGAHYPVPIDPARIEAMGPRVIDLPLASHDRPDRHDPERLSEILVSLA